MHQLLGSERATTLTVSLFGQFSIQFDNQKFEALCKSELDQSEWKTLFSYLLLYRDQPHLYENLASVLWSNVSTAQSKKNLDQALWQLQATLAPQPPGAITSLLQIEPGWIQLHSSSGLWLDVASFESAFNLCRHHASQQLTVAQVQMIQSAVELYQGDLLAGWFPEWCVYERERFQYQYLAMLDKLMNYWAAHRGYETSIRYGTRILHYDQVREQTHRQLMQLYYLAGDRTGALHQYERCVALLQQALGVGPAQQTITLYEQIRTAHGPSPASQVTS